MINVCIHINFKDETSAYFIVECPDLDSVTNYIDKVLNNEYKFIYFHDIMNIFRYYRIDELISVEIECKDQ